MDVTLAAILFPHMQIFLTHLFCQIYFPLFQHQSQNISPGQPPPHFLISHKGYHHHHLAPHPVSTPALTAPTSLSTSHITPPTSSFPISDPPFKFNFLPFAALKGYPAPLLPIHTLPPLIIPSPLFPTPLPPPRPRFACFPIYFLNKTQDVLGFIGNVLK